MCLNIFIVGARGPRAKFRKPHVISCIFDYQVWWGIVSGKKRASLTRKSIKCVHITHYIHCIYTRKIHEYITQAV